MQSRWGPQVTSRHRRGLSTSMMSLLPPSYAPLHRCIKRAMVARRSCRCMAHPIESVTLSKPGRTPGRGLKWSSSRYLMVTTAFAGHQWPHCVHGDGLSSGWWTSWTCPSAAASGVDERRRNAEGRLRCLCRRPRCLLHRHPRCPRRPRRPRRTRGAHPARRRPHRSRRSRSD